MAALRPCVVLLPWLLLVIAYGLLTNRLAPGRPPSCDACLLIEALLSCDSALRLCHRLLLRLPGFMQAAAAHLIAYALPVRFFRRPFDGRPCSRALCMLRDRTSAGHIIIITLFLSSTLQSLHLYCPCPPPLRLLYACRLSLQAVKRLSASSLRASSHLSSTGLCQCFRGGCGNRRPLVAPASRACGFLLSAARGAIARQIWALMPARQAVSVPPLWSGSVPWGLQRDWHRRP